MAITMMTIMFDICGGPACDVGSATPEWGDPGPNFVHRSHSRAREYRVAHTTQNTEQIGGSKWATLYVSLEAATLWWAGREGLMLVLAHESCSVRGSGAVQDCRMVPIIKLLTKKCHPRIHGTRVTFLSLTQ